MPAPSILLATGTYVRVAAGVGQAGISHQVDAPNSLEKLRTDAYRLIPEGGMEHQTIRGTIQEPRAGQEAGTLWGRAALIIAVLVGICAGMLALPAPEGLSPTGQRVIVVAVAAIGLWSTDALPAGLTSMLVVVLLVLLGGVPTFREALAGFAHPVAYFLIGVLTIGLAVSRSGLAERIARFFLWRARGRPQALYIQMLLAFPLLTFLLPSATTRTGILIHVYDQALELSHVPRGAPLAKAIMMALNSINRLASTVLLTGGITPITAAALIGGISWSRWFVLMSVPYYAILLLGSGLIYRLYGRGFGTVLSVPALEAPRPLSGRELRTVLITLGASLLWLTDAWHHWHPALPALLAWICLLAPGIGVLSWSDFERHLGWANVFVLAASLSLAQAMVGSGAAAWLADRLVWATPAEATRPWLVIAMLLLAAAPVRLLIPNITGFLAITIPIAMSVGTATGLNPVVCGLLMMIAGDAVLYYPAQSASSLVVYERGHLSGPEIFRFGLWMTLVAYVVVLIVALPYWTAVGEPLLMGGAR
ncbi:MAG TPA: SLC13 family permease [Alphaproteobacteria bacterium]|nr:SLC13 family permease [Alphaproteobacteria bacterium]